jgi:hypothetical protein
MKKVQSESAAASRTKLKGHLAGIMLATLGKKYPDFADFYAAKKTEIEKITITWMVDAKQKTDGSASPVTNTITVKKFPKSPDDARTVARAIEHLLIWNRGYPYILAGDSADEKTIRQLGELATVIEGTVYEPMVESEIKKYFNKTGAENYLSATKGLAKLIENRQKILPEVTDPRNLLYYSCLYVQKQRLLESTCDAGKVEEYTRRFATHFGDTILPCADKILSVIAKHTTRSPESVGEIFESILWNRNCAFAYRYFPEFDRFVIDQ